MEKLIELRTAEEQEKYNKALAWIKNFAKELHDDTIKMSQDIKDTEAKFRQMYPGVLEKADNEAK